MEYLFYKNDIYRRKSISYLCNIRASDKKSNNYPLPINPLPLRLVGNRLMGNG